MAAPYTKVPCERHNRHNVYCNPCVAADHAVNRHLCRHGYTYGPIPCLQQVCQDERRAKEDAQALIDRMHYATSKADLLRNMDVEGFHKQFRAMKPMNPDIFGPVHIAEEASTTNPCNFHYRPQPGCGHCSPTGNEISLSEAFIRLKFASSVLDANGYRNAKKHLPSQEEVARTGRRPGRLVGDALIMPAMPRVEVTWINIQYENYTAGKTTQFTLTSNAATTVQEDTMSNRPSVVTTVSLSQAENITLADLKSLIAEVERVGGDDSAQVRLNQQAYRWDVTLTVKANEVEPEQTIPTPEEMADLIAEYRATGTRKARKDEIKKILGL